MCLTIVCILPTLVREIIKMSGREDFCYKKLESEVEVDVPELDESIGDGSGVFHDVPAQGRIV